MLMDAGAVGFSFAMINAIRDPRLLIFKTLGPVVVMLGLAVMFGVLGRAVGAVRQERARAVRRQHAHRIFGAPGGVRTAAARFGQGAVEAGARGEESTAALLELLLCIPGASVFHGLRFPGHEEADVDHAALCGNIVFLIDSKLYRWGSYEWRSYGNKDLIVRSDGYGRGKPNWMHVAADAYRSLLGPEVELIPMVLIHGRNTTVGAPSLSSRGVHMLTASQAMERIGNTLSQGALLGGDNRMAREVLAGMLK